MSALNQRIYAARKERLNRGLRTLALWCHIRAVEDHNDDTTMTMLQRKVAELAHAIDRAGWAASNEEAPAPAPADHPPAGSGGPGSAIK